MSKKPKLSNDIKLLSDIIRDSKNSKSGENQALNYIHLALGAKDGLITEKKGVTKVAPNPDLAIMLLSAVITGQVTDTQRDSFFRSRHAAYLIMKKYFPQGIAKLVNADSKGVFADMLIATLIPDSRHLKFFLEQIDETEFEIGGEQISQVWNWNDQKCMEILAIFSKLENILTEWNTFPYKDIDEIEKECWLIFLTAQENFMSKLKKHTFSNQYLTLLHLICERAKQNHLLTKTDKLGAALYTKIATLNSEFRDASFLKYKNNFTYYLSLYVVDEVREDYLNKEVSVDDLQTKEAKNTGLKKDYYNVAIGLRLLENQKDIYPWWDRLNWRKIGIYLKPPATVSPGDRMILGRASAYARYKAGKEDFHTERKINTDSALEWGFFDELVYHKKIPMPLHFAPPLMPARNRDSDPIIHNPTANMDFVRDQYIASAKPGLLKSAAPRRRILAELFEFFRNGNENYILTFPAMPNDECKLALEKCNATRNNQHSCLHKYFNDHWHTKIAFFFSTLPLVDESKREDLLKNYELPFITALPEEKSLEKKSHGKKSTASSVKISIPSELYVVAVPIISPAARVSSSYSSSSSSSMSSLSSSSLLSSSSSASSPSSSVASVAMNRSRPVSTSASVMLFSFLSPKNFEGDDRVDLTQSTLETGDSVLETRDSILETDDSILDDRISESQRSSLT